jgi:hypothetical protein
MLMLVKILDSIASLLFDALKGIISFLEEVIPLLLKIVFGISPFALLILLSLMIGGETVAIIVSIMVLVFISIGVTWAVRNNLTKSSLSLKMFIYVSLLDSLLIVLIASSAGSLPSWPSGSQANEKEQVLVKLLDRAIAQNNAGEIIRAVNELRAMKTKSASPIIIKALQSYYPESHSNETNKAISLACIDALVDINSQESCGLLYEIQIRELALSDRAKDASSRICEKTTAK